MDKIKHSYIDESVIIKGDVKIYPNVFLCGDTVIEDVSLSSQGEQSYINMALSTALHAKRVTKYSISSFDEVDSTFDDDKRQKFIPVMEKIIELNHTTQAFVITHNMMYQQYPVDIIDLNHPEKSTVKMTLE